MKQIFAALLTVASLGSVAHATSAFNYYSCKDSLGNYAHFTQKSRLKYMESSGYQCTLESVPAYPDKIVSGAWTYKRVSGSDWMACGPSDDGTRKCFHDYCYFIGGNDASNFICRD